MFDWIGHRWLRVDRHHQSICRAFTIVLGGLVCGSPFSGGSSALIRDSGERDSQGLESLSPRCVSAMWFS